MAVEPICYKRKARGLAQMSADLECRVLRQYQSASRGWSGG
ncbi:hypothetical protein N288_05790 [Bacillus infantis NRRL B-14911]|uniref:Uncharacterized protein n=1 Tax=Bacillus infantis NRRL B-14911 TaxID=1367477 RepID=U5L8L7_9BACI|nr:hypothetical protein N288_05790 [Bacillus infantis NRRL B-14911]